MKQNITRRLVLYFLFVLILFSIVTGILFLTAATKQAADFHEEELKERALSIASTLSEMPRLGGRRQRMGGGYGAYLKFIDEIAMSEVWLVDESAETIQLGKIGQSFSYEALPPEADQLVKRVFQGDVEVTKIFSPLLEESSITVGAPVRDSSGNVRYVLLLHSRVDGIERVQRSSIIVFSLCTICALLLAFLLSILLARRFIKPLEKMRATTNQLIKGDYSVRTDVSQEDEIGALAGNIDALSQRLSTAEQEREKLEKLRRDFVSNISHELRTPVTVLKGSLEVLDEGLVTDKEEMRSYIRQMLKDTAHLQRLIQDLLELSRLQNTDFQIEKEELNLEDLLTEAVRSMRRLAEKKQVGIVLENTFGAIPFIGDYGRLRQMLVTVLDNAVKFSPSKETVSVKMSQEKHNVILSICDHGPGIPEEDIPHLFERFYGERSAQNQTGTGLGLSIAKQIADRHGIEILCESEIQKGTCFQFVFHLADEKP